MVGHSPNQVGPPGRGRVKTRKTGVKTTNENWYKPYKQIVFALALPMGTVRFARVRGSALRLTECMIDAPRLLLASDPRAKHDKNAHQVAYCPNRASDVGGAGVPFDTPGDCRRIVPKAEQRHRA